MLTNSYLHRTARRSAHACFLINHRRTSRVTCWVLLTMLLALISVPGSFAQVTSGSTLRGVVKDPNKAVVPGATVTLTNTGQGEQRQAKTSGEGAFVFPSIDAGTYNLRVEAGGFKVYEQNGLTIAPSETRGLDVTLEIGTSNETVTVTSDVSPIKTETGERSETITAKQIDNLSIVGRSSLELLRILPGVAAPDSNSGQYDSVSFSGGANASNVYNVNGIRGVENQVSIDGSRVIDIGSNNGTIITPNNDMVSEVTVKSSNYAAEYGASGVQISATTKAGTRDFHGELYDYWRPRQLQANDRSNTVAGTPRPKSQFQYPGGNIGGPVLLPFTHLNRNHDRLFFFVGFEVQRQSIDPGTRFGVVPTAAERNGDFSASGKVCVPTTFGYAVSGCTTVPGGNLAPYANPIGKALLNLYPLPNFVGAPGSGQARYNYASAVLAPTNRTDLKMRFDYKVSNKTNLYVRLARESESNDSPYGIWWGPSAYELPSHVLGTNLGRSAAVNVTTVLSSTMTNEAVFSASKLKLFYNYADPSKVTLSALGIQNLQRPFPTKSPYAPLALISWDVNTQLWEAGQSLPLFAYNDSYSATDTLSKIYKNHTLKFGGLIERAGKTQNINGGNEGPEGQLEFEGGGNQARTTGIPGPAGAFANLFVGRLDSFAQSTDVPTGNFHFWNFEGFAQDSWKVRPNFTLEYGLRLSYYPNNVETTGLAVAFSPSAYVRGAGAFLNGNLQDPNGYLLASRGQLSNGVFKSNPAPQFAPRLNFAWDIFGNASTVIRGGAGLFYNRYQGNYLYGILTSPPNTIQANFSSWSVPNNDLTLSNLGSLSSQVISGIGTTSVSSLDINENRVPRIATVSLSVARKLPFQNVLEVAYVGTFGRHLPQTLPVDFIPPGTLGGTLGNANLSDPLERAAVIADAARNGNLFQRLLPYPDYSGVQFTEWIGTSNYHSLQVTLNRQVGKRFQYFIAYTFSKALGTSSNSEVGGDIVDPVDIRGRNYGVLSFDRTHILNISYNYNFPNGARGAFNHKLLRGALNGWQMSGITTFQSGLPIRLNLGGAITSSANLFAYFGTNSAVNSGNGAVTGGIHPVFLSNPQTGNTSVNGNYLNLSQIQLPTFGTSGPYEPPFTLRGPFTNNFDVTFFKNFAFTESKKLQFRAGFFNIFNEAFPDPTQGDIYTTLNTVCNATAPAGINNGVGTTNTAICDPTKGFSFDTTTINNFGKVVNKHGHRRVELALKFYF